MNDETVERLAFWLFKRGRQGALRDTMEIWTWLPAVVKQQWLDEAREALTYARPDPA